MVIFVNAWIIYGQKKAEYNKEYIEFYFKEGKQLGIFFSLIIVEFLKFGILDGTWFLHYEDENINKPDFVICRTIYPLLTRHLEWMGVMVFNNSKVAEICNDKAKTYQYIAKTGIPILDTEFLKYEYLVERQKNWSEKKVIKTVDGHGGNQVFLKKSGEDIKTFIDKLNGNPVVVQPFVGKRKEDLRVYVIGKKIIGAVLRTGKEDFKSNYSLGGEVRAYDLLEEEKNLVKQVINCFDFGLVGVDFLIGDCGELIFNEIEDVVGARMFYQCHNINLVKEYLTFILDKIDTTT